MSKVSLYIQSSFAVANASGDIWGIVVLVSIILFLLWLIATVIHKKLAGTKKEPTKMEEKQDKAEKARVKSIERQTKKEIAKQKEDKKELEKHTLDLQDELLQKARQRRDEELNYQNASCRARKQVLAASYPPQNHKEESDNPCSLKQGLSKTRAGFVTKLTQAFGHTCLDQNKLEHIEEILFTADIGVHTVEKLMNFLQNELRQKQIREPEKLLNALKAKIRSILAVHILPPYPTQCKPLVTLIVGVNGSGKTTTIGKLAFYHTSRGQKVVLAAGDTFRAAAQEQLQIWAKRARAHLISAQQGSDPGAVVFDAINAAKSEGADVVIADTAGRLHTKINLMEELCKIERVCNKAMKGAPHEVWLVIDATCGQNAINQAQEFHKALNLTGIILTKLDGTAKGGIIIGITDTFNIPVRYIGIGEHIDDLRPFDADAFVKALFY